MANTKSKNNDDEQILNPEQLPGLIETLLTRTSVIYAYTDEKKDITTIKT